MANRSFDPKAFLEAPGDGKALTSIRTGQAVYKQGAIADQVFYLRAGRAKETVSSGDGKEAVVGIIDPGRFFGAGGLDGVHHRMSTVTAITGCAITAISHAAMLAAFREPSFVQMFMAYLLDHNSKIEAEKVDLLFEPHEQLLMRKLLVLSGMQHGAPQVIGPEITQEMLAQMIGSTRPRVNYFLNKFRNLGFIKYNGGITVLPALLKAVGEKQ